MDKQKVLDMLEELEDLLCKDIKNVVAKNDISPPDYQCLDTSVDIFKDIETIKAMIQSDYGYPEENMRGMASGNMGMNSYGYSGAQNMNSGGYMPQYYNSYDDGRYSGARGRSSNSGRYISRDDEMTAKLDNMMRTAGSEQERQIIGRMMNEIGR